MTEDGKHKICVCMGAACRANGAEAVINNIISDMREGCPENEMYVVEACGCLHACGLAPVVVIDGDVCGKATAENVKNRHVEKTADQCLTF